MTRIGIVTAAAVLALLATAGAWAAGMMGMMGMGRMSAARHQYVMRNGIGSEYAGLRNPLARSEQNLATGQALYRGSCAACHGEAGRGEGPAASSLNPPPADLAAVVRTPMATDGYLFWTIAEGGGPVGTAMPPFKSTLSDTDIWRIVLYLRGL